MYDLEKPDPRLTTRLAGTDLRDRLGYIVRLIPPDVVVLASDRQGGQTAIEGVICSRTPSGRAVAIAVKGPVDVIAAGPIRPGARVTTNSYGQAITAQSGDMTLGVSQHGADWVGAAIRVLLQLPSTRLDF